MADRLWGKVDGKSATENRVGHGRVVCGRHPQDVLKELGLPPDVDVTTQNIHWTHRQCGQADVYFLSNQDAEDRQTEVTFRVTGKAPELWDPVTGEMRPLPEFRSSETRTTVPLQFAPHQSYFVVFRTGPVRKEGKNFPELSPVATIAGPWDVTFDPKWGGPEKVTFEKLEDWTVRSEEGIKYYSGTAVYSCRFEIPDLKSETFLDLGAVKNLAEVSLNGQPLGIVWCPPWRVRIPAGMLRDKGQRIGDPRDQHLGQPPDRRRTPTGRRLVVRGIPEKPDFPNQTICSLLAEPKWLADDLPALPRAATRSPRSNICTRRRQVARRPGLLGASAAAEGEMKAILRRGGLRMFINDGRQTVTRVAYPGSHDSGQLFAGD